MNKIVVNGSTVEGAIELGLQKLDKKRNEVEVNVLKEATKGLFGFGSKDAEVELIVKFNAVDVAKEFLNDIFLAMDIDVRMSNTVIDEQQAIDLAGSEIAVLIGRRGQTLDALQYLVNIRINKLTSDSSRVLLDAENYRERRKNTLEELAERLASKANKTNRDVVLEPMTPYERKIIHTYLQDKVGIKTSSQGQEPHRKVVISLDK